MPNNRIAVQQPDYFLGELVEVKGEEFDLTLSQQVAQAADDLARPLIVLDDIGQDRPHLINVRWVSGEEALCRLGIAQDSGKWLV